VAAQNEHRIQRVSVERLRQSPPSMIQVLTSDVIRQHVDRIEPATVADLFALSELNLAGGLGPDLSNWAARAAREILDMPDGDRRIAFLEEVARIPADHVPARMREAIVALVGVAGAAATPILQALQTAWAAMPPAEVTPPAPRKTDAAAKATAEKKPATRKPATPKAAKTPAPYVDPRRAEWIREDALVRLSAREYADRGLKESIFVDGIRHRSPYKDLTIAEVLTELRKLERERKLKHTADRWMVK
jgi:hypothetical protein